MLTLFNTHIFEMFWVKNVHIVAQYHYEFWLLQLLIRLSGQWLYCLQNLQSKSCMFFNYQIFFPCFALKLIKL